MDPDPGGPKTYGSDPDPQHCWWHIKNLPESQDVEVEAYEYSWGERAEAEVKKSSVFRMVCEVYEVEPRMFKEQYEKVKELEGLDDETFMQ